MTSLSENTSRQRLINALVVLGALFVFIFWSIELYRALDARDQAAERVLAQHEELDLDKKQAELSRLFGELYSNVRTISLLPMVRGVTGENRRSTEEDVVANGRFSLDAHHTMQQIYTNLQTHLHVSEVYLVLDGFNPGRGDIPFFMYDDLIVGRGAAAAAAEVRDDHAPTESEEFEYNHFPKQLGWFREYAGAFAYAERLDRIPVRLSPMMRTCDNSQFLSEKFGDLRDVEGLIYAMPVYALEGEKKLTGMVTTVVRRNVLEAKLIGVPFLPLTTTDLDNMKKAGWSMPKDASPYVLRNAEYGIDIYDRRNPAFKDGLDAAFSTANLRWAKREIDLRTGSPWTLYYNLVPTEVDELTESLRAEKREVVIGRVMLLLLLMAVLIWAVWLMRRGRRELLWMAHYDSLTELPNRRAFFERLASAMARAKRNDTRTGLFFIDIVGFNAINDTLGQKAGDLLLSAVGQRLVESVRGSDAVVRNPVVHRSADVVSRLGGDEFTILCEELASGDDLATVAERIMSAMDTPIKIGNHEVEVSLYAGVAVYPEDAKDGESLLMAAESAMHLCRKRGPGYLLYNEEMRKRAARQHQLTIEVSHALERGQFQLFYQPKASLDDGHIVSLEALLRWKHPELGMISPIEFIPLLESSGRIVEVGEWVLVQSCRDILELEKLGFGHVGISANVSVRQLRRGDFHQTVERVLKATGAPPERLILEITESMVMENLQEGRMALERLKSLGLRLAIDDFGTGYSSLTYLQFLPLDYLKLDKSFIDGMTNDQARHIVKTVIVLAQGLKLHTIAEGIETVLQQDELRDLGCDIIQGYLLSKPKPLDDIVEWLNARPR